MSSALSFAKILKSRGIERITFKKGLTLDELTTFVSSFIKLKNIDAIKASENIIIGKVKLKAKDYSEIGEVEEATPETELEEGFELVGESDMHANPKDKPTIEEFVWRLPPGYSGSRDNSELKAKMDAIGESNRMTLKFRKP